MSAKRKGRRGDPAAIERAVTLLEALIEEFDVDDPEDVKLRVENLTEALEETGIFTAPPPFYSLDLAAAVAAIKGPRSRRKLLHVVGFLSKIREYHVEPGGDTMYEALDFLTEFGPPLVEDLKEFKEA